MLKILNFRTLAKNATNIEGKRIIPNTVFRSGAIAYASKMDVRKLKSYGLKDIYDFRSKKEIASMPTLSSNHFATHHFDILEEAANSDPNNYINLTREELNSGVIKLYSEDFAATDGYKDVVACIANQKNTPFLFHCTAGKDRTGIFGAIFMMILDFDLQSIKNEYLKIDKRSMRILGRHMLKKTGVKSKDIDSSKFEGVMGVLPEFIDAFFNSVFNSHKSINSYLEEKVGVTPAMKAELKSKYLI